MLIYIALFLLTTNNAFCQDILNPIHLTFIKNEAFVIKDSNYKLLIDYDNSSSLTNDSYDKSKPPFDNIDFISISHIHVDHYCKNMTGNYLDNNSNCRLILPNEVFEEFKTYKNYEIIKDRIFALNLTKYNCTDKIIGNNSFKYIMVPHANGFTQMQNLIFIFKSGNIKFLHTGDYWGDDIDSLKCNLLNEKIDVAIIHHCFLTKPNIDKGLERINKFLKPKYIILMHIPQDSERMAEALEAKEVLKDKYPNIFIFTSNIKTIKIYKTDDLIKIE